MTNIFVSVRTYDTGATDPFKFYVFKGVPATDDTTTSLTQIGVTGTITPSATNKITTISTDISSSNTFSAQDHLWVMLKDSTSGNQDAWFSVRISGVYT